MGCFKQMGAKSDFFFTLGTKKKMFLQFSSSTCQTAGND